ncbi:MAG: sensor histidine kinase [Desulfobacterales bacterium]
MITDPKTGDDPAWVFGASEPAGGQVSDLLKQRCPVSYRPLPNGKNLPRQCVDFEPVTEFVRPDGSAAAGLGKDIVELIKRARSRTDLSPAVLNRGGGQAPHLVTAAQNSLEGFIFGIAHHFNNLFMTVQGNVSLILGATVGNHRHERRFKRLERLVMSESMLTNDLLAVVVQKGCYIDGQLQAFLLDEIIAISDTVAMRRAFCGLPGAPRLTPGASRRALRRFGDSLIRILQRLLTEIEEHTAFIIADDSANPTECTRLRKIMTTVGRGQKLLNDLKHYCGSSVPVAKRIGAATLAEIVRRTCCGKREDIDCHLIVAPNSGDIEIDGGWLGIILKKLYDNAAEAMPHGGKIWIEIENLLPNRSGRQNENEAGNAAYVRLQFKDSGPGMSADVAARIFDPFYKTKPEKIHNGLGLAVVDGLVQTTGGRIDVASTPGEGTMVTIDLPVAGISSNLFATNPVAELVAGL